MAMDWFSWLSKTGLEPSLVYEYGVSLAHNELEEEDITHFNHEFLQSIGISIAKHRLEILKVAHKEAGRRPRPMSKFLAIVNKAKGCLAKCIQTWVHRNDSVLIVVPRKACEKRWRGAFLKRNKRLGVFEEGRLLMVNDGSVSVANCESEMVCENKEERVEDGGGRWNGVEEIRWASMFQDLKPT